MLLLLKEPISRSEKKGTKKNVNFYSLVFLSNELWMGQRVSNAKVKAKPKAKLKAKQAASAASTTAKGE